MNICCHTVLIVSYVLAMLIPAQNAYAESKTTNKTEGKAESVRRCSLRVGSKTFTESVILGEVLRQHVAAICPAIRHIKELGGTRIVWNALLAGDIDMYAEYTGTLAAEIFAEETSAAGRAPANDDDERLSNMLRKFDIAMTAPLGFANTYALGVRRETAEKLGLRTISDLKYFPHLRFGFSNEFIDRRDGWHALRQRYALPHTHVRGLQHDIAYRALVAGQNNTSDDGIDLTELYSTDAEIQEHNLVILLDDKKYFPDYRCVIVYRRDIHPEAAQHLALLAGKMTEATMIRMNADAKMRNVPEERIAAEFLRTAFAQQNGQQQQEYEELKTTSTNSYLQEHSLLWRVTVRTAEHLHLTLISLLAAALVAIPLGICAAYFPRIGNVIIGITGIVQTIPSLALLVLMIPLLGIGAAPAICALFIYSLLPIVRSTAVGITTIPQDLHESAIILGLQGFTRLLRVELPLTSPFIWSGIKTAAVINVGTATLGAIIGAGGHGQPILTGIRLANTATILEGAVPAALLALAVQQAITVLERIAVPHGLQEQQRR